MSSGGPGDSVEVKRKGAVKMYAEWQGVTYYTCPHCGIIVELGRYHDCPYSAKESYTVTVSGNTSLKQIEQKLDKVITLLEILKGRI